MKLCRIALLAATLFASPSLRADDWPAWRGADGQGMCKEKDLPLKWSPTENVVWKTPLPDQGNSTPIIWKGRVYITQAAMAGKKRSTICFNAEDGKKIWEKTVDYPDAEPTHATNPFCSASPVTDGERIVVWHGSAGVYCYDLDGKELWKRELGKCHHIWGNASSPVIWNDRVFLNFGPGDPTYLLAMNKVDGKDLWKVDILGGKEGKKGETWIGSWSTPVVAKFGDSDELLVSWPGVLKSHDPKTGKVLWECAGLAKDKANDQLVYTSPIFGPGVVVAMAGYGGPAIGVKTGGTGDVTETHRLWRHPSAPQRIGSGVVLGDHAYVVNEPGVAQCIEWKTGKTIWNERIGAGVWGSLVHSDGRLYVTNLEGETVVMAAKPTFEELARNKLGERTLSSMAVSNGRLYIRTYKHLWCIGK